MGDLLMRDLLRHSKEKNLDSYKLNPDLGPWNAPSELEDICSSRQRLEFASAFVSLKKNLREQTYKYGCSDNLQRDTHFYGNSQRTKCQPIAEKGQKIFFEKHLQRSILNTENLRSRRATDSSFPDLDSILDPEILREKLNSRAQKKQLIRQNASLVQHGSKAHREYNSVQGSRSNSPLSWIIPQERGRVLKFSSPKTSSVLENYDEDDYDGEHQKKREELPIVSFSEERNIIQNGTRNKDSHPFQVADNYVQLWTMLRHPWQQDDNLKFPQVKGAMPNKRGPDSHIQVAAKSSTVAIQNLDRIHLARQEIVQLKKFKADFPNVLQISRLEQHYIQPYPSCSSLKKRKLHQLSNEGKIKERKKEQSFEAKERTLIIYDEEDRPEQLKQQQNQQVIKFSPPPDILERKLKNEARRYEKVHNISQSPSNSSSPQKFNLSSPTTPPQIRSMTINNKFYDKKGLIKQYQNS